MMSPPVFRSLFAGTASLLTALLLSLVILPGAAVAESAAGASEQIAAHLEAGEFQSALAIAQAVEEESERQPLLTQISAAQLEQGEFQASEATLQQMPMNRTRVQMAARKASEQALQGTGADFDSLIELIMAQTDGLWMDEDGAGGSINEYETGVRVDPTGLLVRMTKTEENTHLQELGLKSRQASLNADMAQASSLRMVSLTRLEQAVQDRLEQGLPVAESMRNLAGLHQITHVFVYPETGEIVIAGPAAGWGYTTHGLPVSQTNGAPTLQLDDLVTVLRTFSAQGQGIFGCSINPRQEGMRELKEFVEASQDRGPISSRSVRSWANQLQRKLGLQDVEIYGVPAHSRVARVIVEADYRMKLIGIGKLEGGSQIPDYFELMTASQVADTSSLDALRWWMSLKCDAVLRSESGQAFEIQNSSVLCQSENQFVNAQGERIQTGQAEETNRQFAANFTEHYQNLSQQDLVFADMQNIFDLAMVAALIQRERLADTIGWDYGAFANDGAYHPAQYEAPLVVDSVVNHKVYNGKNIVVQVAGGVRVDAASQVAELQVSPRLDQVARTAEAPQLAEGRWWWDSSK